MPRRETSSCCPAVVPTGIVSLDWLDQTDPGAPVAVIVPGLTGDSSSRFVQRVAAHLWTQHGMRVACYNPRARGGNPLATPFLYSVGYTEDLRRVIAHIHEVYPSAPICAAGYSLGRYIFLSFLLVYFSFFLSFLLVYFSFFLSYRSNYLAKYVGEEKEHCVLRAAVCLACPVDCLQISNSLTHSLLGKIVDPALVQSVQRVRASIEHVLKTDTRYNLQHIAEAKTMAEFDDRAIAPMFDFACASDYYRHSSSGLFLSSIRTPTLFLHADNDPIVPGIYIQMDNFRSNPHIMSVMTQEGAHSMDWPDTLLRPWSASAIGHFFDLVLQSAPAPDFVEVD
jgi:predicted alpha/beta-fold hydrolase